MTEMHDGHPLGEQAEQRARTRKAKPDASNDKTTDRPIWIGYRDESTWYPFSGELAASRWALKGSKPRVVSMIVGTVDNTAAPE